MLFRNDGDGTFSDVTTPTLAGYQYTTSAAFGDFDADGWLDVYVDNYIEAFDFPFHSGEPKVLLRNRGDGTFSDVTVACGVGGAGTTLAVSWSDVGGDRDPDLWVGNDFGASWCGASVSCRAPARSVCDAGLGVDQLEVVFTGSTAPAPIWLDASDLVRIR